MKHFGRTLLAGFLVAVAPAGVLSAAADDAATTVGTLAGQAAEVAAEEQAILDALAGELTAADRAELEARMRTVDARGAALLDELDLLDVQLTQAIRTSLAPLPRPTDVDDPATLLPQDAVYTAAIADLTRIAETPDAVIAQASSGSSPAMGLLVVAAASLLVLGAAALGNSLRRRPDDELTATAWSDGLTGLANRRRLDADVERHGDVPTAAIMVDIDHFATINDDFGHALGDQILQEVGRRLAEHVRYDDVVYRYAGEEFCVLLPGASIHDAGEIAERIVEAARGIELPDGRHVTVSVGVAGDGDAASVLLRADQAMSAAKQHGRDRSVTSDGVTVAG